MGGEYRRFIGDSFAQNPGILTFSSTANFINGIASSFSVTPTQVNSRIFENSAGGFISDNYKVTPRFQAEVGFRYEWNGTPTEGGGRLVNFDPNTSSLVHVSQAYNQNFNYEPRVGFIYDLLGDNNTVLRGGYGIMADEPVSGVVTGLAGNPPNANPVSESGSRGYSLLQRGAGVACSQRHQPEAEQCLHRKLQSEPATTTGPGPGDGTWLYRLGRQASAYSTQPEPVHLSEW
jgi:hypothetical protein